MQALWSPKHLTDTATDTKDTRGTAGTKVTKAPHGYTKDTRGTVDTTVTKVYLIDTATDTKDTRGVARVWQSVALATPTRTTLSKLSFEFVNYFYLNLVCHTGVYPGFTIGGFLAVARVARAKNLATTPTFRPHPLINDRLFIKDGHRLLDSRRF